MLARQTASTSVHDNSIYSINNVSSGQKHFSYIIVTAGEGDKTVFVGFYAAQEIKSAADVCVGGQESDRRNKKIVDTKDSKHYWKTECIAPSGFLIAGGLSATT